MAFKTEGLLASPNFSILSNIVKGRLCQDIEFAWGINLLIERETALAGAFRHTVRMY